MSESASRNLAQKVEKGYLVRMYLSGLNSEVLWTLFSVSSSFSFSD